MFSIALTRKRNLNKTIFLCEGMNFRCALIFTCVVLISSLLNPLSAQSDTLSPMPVDTLYFSSEQQAMEEVHYFGKDSTVMDLINDRVYLYGLGSYVTYGDLELKAGYIAFSLTDNIAFATGFKDSVGVYTGRPVFKQGETSFEEDSLGYNFKSKRGISYGVRTEESDAYLHTAISKMQIDKTIHIRKGKFTTCSNPNPHFHFQLSKAIIIPNEKIVSGPLYLQFRKVPVPLGLPFGFFPNKKESTYGILIPGYGNGRAKGFFVQNLGYYFPINEHIDTRVLFDIYTGGSWSARNVTNYKKRYKYQGSFNVSRTVNKTGFRELPNYIQQSTFNVRWNHTQDPKARPNESFNANVNLGSSQNFRNNLNATQQDFLTGTFNSAVQWSKSFPGKPFSLAVSANHTQNTQSQLVQITLPSAAFNVSRINLLKKVFPKSPIGINASVNAEQQLSAFEQEFGQLTMSELLNKAQSGVRLNSTASTSWKLGQFITLNPSATFTGFGTWKVVSPISDAQLDTVAGFKAAGNWSTQISADTRIYGTFVRKGAKKLKAVRHMIQPRVGFSYTPYQNFQQFGFYGVNGDFLGYSPFDAARFAPASSSQTANMNFSVNQNVEAKVRDESSAKVVYKKVKIIDSFRTSTSRNFMADSIQWSNLNFAAFTTVGKFLTMNYSSSYSMYDRDSLGRKIDTFLNESRKGIARMEGTNLALGIVVRSKQAKPSSNQTSANPATTPQQQEILSTNQAALIDFNVPWNLSVNYNLRMSKNWLVAQQRDSTIYTQAVTFMGDVAFAKRLALSFNGGYDFNAKEMTTTTIGLHVDLHCWELSANVVPFGIRQSYFIQLNIKSALLQDLKLQRRGNLGEESLLY